MNLILFEPHEIDVPLPCGDRRAKHVLNVLRRRPGDTFDAGLVNGPKGKGTLVAIESNALRLAFSWGAAPSAPDPITVVVGLPRPQTARDILREATALGVAKIHFVAVGKGDPGYARSTLWSSGEWRRHLLAGAEQAFDPRVPEVTHGHPLAEVLDTLPPGGGRYSLDNYEAPVALSRVEPTVGQSVVLAIGPERGWSADERCRLRETGFVFVHLGARVLRVETAVIAALALVRSRMDLM